MSSLLDFTAQGDVGTMTDESKLPQVKLMTPVHLSAWERQNWVSHEIDLAPDQRDWATLPEELRDEMLWGPSAFFVGEERVTCQFSGLVLAAEDKHDGSIEERLQRAGRDLTPDYFKLFDGYLVDDHLALLADPSDIEAKVDFVTTYHMVIEGTLALTGQYFQTDKMERRGILPGHLKAFNLIAQDEHRHVAYGT